MPTRPQLRAAEKPIEQDPQETKKKLFAHGTTSRWIGTIAASAAIFWSGMHYMAEEVGDDAKEAVAAEGGQLEEPLSEIEREAREAGDKLENIQLEDETVQALNELDPETIRHLGPALLNISLLTPDGIAYINSQGEDFAIRQSEPLSE